MRTRGISRHPLPDTKKERGGHAYRLISPETIARRDFENLQAGAHDLGTYTIAPYNPDHGFVLATCRVRYQARERYNRVLVGNVGRRGATELWMATATSEILRG